MIDPAFRDRIECALDDIERDHSVRILLAVESGSRAWGFPSRDSDHDVRFVYVRPLGHYLRVKPFRDVLEQPIDDLLDLGGWDLRKALGHTLRSNAVLGEWLSSPVIYRQDTEAVEQLRNLNIKARHLPALRYHYDRLARNAWEPGDDDIRLKAYFYALRPALTLLWLRRNAAPSPMDLPTLMSGLRLPLPVMETIERLLAQKEAASEADEIPRDRVLDSFLAETLAERAPRPEAWTNEDANVAVDTLFAHWADHRKSTTQQ